MRSYRPPKKGNWTITARQALTVLAVIAMICSAIYWWGVQTVLTGHWMVALAYTAILTLAPPALMAFMIPWSPAGMLLQKINARTWGYAIVITAALFLLYYSFEIQWSWWSSQQAVADSGLILQQALIGIIGFIVVPALLWAPVSTDELVEQIRQEHLVRKYELQVQSDIALLRTTLLRAQEKALLGFANLTAAEREDLANVLIGLVAGIDNTLRQIGESVEAVSGATVPFDSLTDNEDVRQYLEYIAESLTNNALPDTRQQQRSLGDGRTAGNSAGSPPPTSGGPKSAKAPPAGSPPRQQRGADPDMFAGDDAGGMR